MKTASHKFFAGAVVLAAVFGVMHNGSLYAQATVAGAAAAASAAKIAATGSVAPPAIPLEAAQPGGGSLANPPAGPGNARPVALKPQDATSVAASDAASAENADSEPEDGMFENQNAPKQVRSLVRRLENDKVDLSLEDMNQARAALARLDLLLALEQKLTDLDKLRTKRKAAEMADMVGSMLPPGVARMGGHVMSAALTPPVPPSPLPVAMRMPAKDYSVQKIEGVNGVYKAVLTSADDQKSTVQEGDDLPDGAEVIAITSTTVQLRLPNDEGERTLHVSNIGAVSNGRRMP